jgi:hypothetical protein
VFDEGAEALAGIEPIDAPLIPDANMILANIITARLSRALNLLYSLPPGSSLTTTGRATTTQQSNVQSASGLIYGPIIEYHGQP